MTSEEYEQGIIRLSTQLCEVPDAGKIARELVRLGITSASTPALALLAHYICGEAVEIKPAPVFPDPPKSHVCPPVAPEPVVEPPAPVEPPARPDSKSEDKPKPPRRRKPRKPKADK